MLKELIDNYIINKKVVITSAPANGCTTLLLNIIEYLSIDNSCLLYNPTDDINNYIKNIYSNIYNNVLFYKDSTNRLIEFLLYSNFDIDVLSCDPGDTLLNNKKIIYFLLKRFKNTFITTSQIRQNPNTSQIYSTIENLELFDYSIWIRNVSENDDYFIRRYIDVYNVKRKGNNFISRYVVRFNKKTGVMST